ncbi:Intradiol ring-cleavage dioxygenase [Lactarius akahatsu]|uniref:Intradiol ring-cleavage dioxygenase n=1 Tax=Lactarius akahatsu TaxID=416441 RepID=A0AAD4LCE5_9AGAM|nr:Intradiol ring-cleavage dioxygenase [Lactarius akahatsu]
MSALLCANDAGELEFMGFSLYGQTPQQTASTQFPKRLPLQRINTRGLYSLAWWISDASVHNVHTHHFPAPAPIPLDPFKLLLPGPITLYRTIIAFTLLAFFPCLASPPSFTSLDLTLKSEYITKLHVRQRLGDAAFTPNFRKYADLMFIAYRRICTPLHQEFILLSDVLGMSALVDALNDLPVSAGTESSVSGPFFTEDAPDVPLGESSERKGEYLYAEGHVCTTSCAPIPGAVIKTWETDDKAVS